MGLIDMIRLRKIEKIEVMGETYQGHWVAKKRAV
jgi:hypothetical protein